MPVARHGRQALHRNSVVPWERDIRSFDARGFVREKFGTTFTRKFMFDKEESLTHPNTVVYNLI